MSSYYTVTTYSMFDNNFQHFNFFLHPISTFNLTVYSEFVQEETYTVHILHVYKYLYMYTHPYINICLHSLTNRFLIHGFLHHVLLALYPFPNCRWWGEGRYPKREH
jgi:hypothetical protein